MKNQLTTFLVSRDEDSLSHYLRELCPSVAFVDYEQVALPEPVICESLIQCPSGLAWIWASGTNSTAERTELWTTGVANQQMGPMVQFHRSRQVSETLVNGTTVDLLLSGRVAITPQNDAQKRLKKNVNDALSRLATSSVYPVSPTTREQIGTKCPGIRVGHDTETWCTLESRLLRHSGMKTLYCLPQSTIRNPG